MENYHKMPIDPETGAHRPQVLLLGNGIIRAYSHLALSWHELLKEIGTDKTVPDNPDMPMPMEIILRTNDHVDLVLQDHIKQLYGSVDGPEFQEILLQLLGLGFDHILTTNYSYELEEAALGKAVLSDEEIRPLERFSSEVSAPEDSFMLFTWNEVSANGCRNRIWHIHGEAMKPDSVIIGHFYYGTLLSKCDAYIQKGRRSGLLDYQNKEVVSWVDAFMLGDVYTLGFGYDFSEMDLWWLLNYKKLAPGGSRMYYYRPRKDIGFDCKASLMRAYGTETLDCGCREISDSPDDPAVQAENDAMYREFYSRAIDDIRRRVALARRNG